LLQSNFFRKNLADFIYFKFESFVLRRGRHKSQAFSRRPLIARSEVKPRSVNAGIVMALGKAFYRLH